MISYIYDTEIFPNFFCVTFVSPENNKVNKFVIAKDLGVDNWKELHDFLDRELLLVGYNNIIFDSRILDFAFNNNTEDLNWELSDLSNSIISEKGFEERNYFEYHPHNQWKQLDLMKLQAYDKLGISLKQIAVNLKWHRIQDLPLPYAHNVTNDEIKLVLDYNLNDVLISKKLYNALSAEINLRKELSLMYNVDLSSASDSKIANVLLEKFYTEETGLEIESLKYLRTKREMLWIKDCIANGIYFKTEKLQSLKLELDNLLVVAENNFAYKKKIEFANCKYELGIGGLHSDDCPAKFYTDKNYIIKDADVSSYYPFIIINNKIKPEHLNENFIDVLKKITEQRIAAKNSGDKVKADGLKITINSIFGKLGSEYFWLQDPKALLTTTVSGQLYLLMLIEALTLAGITVISANTDGVTSAIPRNLENTYSDVCSDWQKNTGFDLEITDYSMYVRSDVNNYIVKKADGKTKEKGRYLKEINLKKGYRFPIIPIVLYDYFVNGKPVEQGLKDSKDILDFCASQKAGKNFRWEYRSESDVEHLQKTNRFFISKSGGKLVKVNTKKESEIGLYVENNVTILNNYDSSYPFSKYKIDYDFYVKEAHKYIDEIESSNFDLTLKTEKLGDENLEIDEEIKKSNAKILSPRFRLSGSGYIYDKEKNIVYRGIGNIKYLNNKIGKELYEIKDKRFDTWLDFLIYCEENLSLNSRQFEILICLNFFEEFGGNKKLLEFFKEFEDGKSKYKKTLTDKSKQKRIPILSEILEDLHDCKYNIKEQIDFQNKYIGHVEGTFSIDKKYIYIQDLNLKYSPRIEAYSLGTGKNQILKVQKKIFANKPFEKNDIIYCNRFEEKPAMSYKDGEWVPNPDKKEWWLTSYELVKNYESLFK